MASAEMGTDLHCCETFCLVVVMVFIKVAKAEGEAGEEMSAASPSWNTCHSNVNK